MAYGLPTYNDSADREDLLDIIKTITPSKTPLMSRMATLGVPVSGVSGSTMIFPQQFTDIQCPNCKKEFEEGSAHNCMSSLKNLLKNV